MLLLCFFQLLIAEYLSARCFSDQYLGLWSFTIAKDRHLKSNDYVGCNSRASLSSRVTLLNVTLMDNGVAQSQGGYTGRWTPIGNHGFELRIATDVFYVISAFSAEIYNDTHYKVSSRCDKIHFGWRTTQGIQPLSFYCLTGSLIKPLINYNVTTHYVQRDVASELDRKPALVPKQRPSSKSRSARKAKTASFLNASSWNLQLGDPPPAAWSWGDVGGASFLPAAPPASPGRGCNSSYVEAALAAMMARVMVASNRTDPLGQQTFLSARHVLDCSQYGQGCAGGTPFEVGKFSEDFGIFITDYYIPDDQGGCVANRTRRPEVRYYFSNYGYLGSYYGNTNAQDDIIWEIYRHGPVVASVYANADWDNCDENSTEDVRYVVTEDDSTSLEDYSSASANRSLRHFYASNTNHTVLIVGWGSDEVTGDYWLVLDPARSRRNTCGGPLRKISRGVNAYNIEAEVVVMYWAPYPDFLHPEEYFLTVRCSTIVLMAILLLVFSLISIVSIGTYICLRIRVEKEHRKCISISDLDAPQKVMPLIPSGQTEISTDTSSVLLDSVTPNCEQEESEELSMLSNP
ncbi:Encystation-specific protease [Giardia duodenalis]|uniref:Encystation-specific protease n=1 Tax=Giardia intestinalis (strain ATCC 50803 / WB clone C6) TaxID=184922 RepID=A8BCF2_GIAIC|nr:Encystation-specific protease [Giardia intestinalis]KAE8301385.1 Encystation-specific protease [Giardia intestinalis]|eukprot:XP_001707889.1 Encystation-specific protease [Giardia lamblia ATCC 50803]